ncbi:MAG: hypothetical protein D6758_12070 [Gammaproteobacteria bacterium]|nr:MAG: hypothetical protein D6758_12070 [Gammaproteobacteria bacterium]
MEKASPPPVEHKEGAPHVVPSAPAEKADRMDAPCSGRFQRGIAYLMRLEGDRAWFEFVPGDRTMALPARPDWRIGREFRAEWFMPDPAQTRCRERLELVAPLP